MLTQIASIAAILASVVTIIVALGPVFRTVMKIDNLYGRLMPADGKEPCIVERMICVERGVESLKKDVTGLKSDVVAIKTETKIQTTVLGDQNEVLKSQSESLTHIEEQTGVKATGKRDTALLGELDNRQNKRLENKGIQ